ncbi:8943_t:CDS:2 [Cetraspora pellucida]|uniref:8943_t:CDS:1 n=1 Tax=Cetraspora pellucida TaxID=1433469 RepID=A0A9N9GPF2_9GLOM|nr:8943_t:CDS:2 [Cetraspora pellucida]
MVEVLISYSGNEDLQDQLEGMIRAKADAKSPAIYLTVIEVTLIQDSGPSKCGINEYLKEFAQIKELDNQQQE